MCLAFFQDRDLSHGAIIVWRDHPFFSGKIRLVEIFIPISISTISDPYRLSGRILTNNPFEWFAGFPKVGPVQSETGAGLYDGQSEWS